MISIRQPLLTLAFLFPLAIPSSLTAGDWPHWRGPSRDGKTSESSGWVKGRDWPAPSASWRKSVGEGASSPVVQEGRVYTLGWESGRDVVRCLDLESGEILWEQSYEAPQYGRHARGDQKLYRGATATPELDPEGGLLFTLGCDGDLRAWDIREGGNLVWEKNLYEAFAVPQRPQITRRKNTLRDYGYTSSPFVHGNRLIVEVGDPKGGNLVGFEKHSGDPIWHSENRDPAGHTGGPTPVTIDGVPCVAVATSFGLHVARIEGDRAGETVAFHEWKTDFSNTIAGVAVSGQDLLISSRYNQMAMARIEVRLGKAPREVWRNRYPTGVCTPVIHDGKIYFANKGIFCVDFETGDLDWAGGKIGDAGSCLLTSEERLVVWGNGGDLSLVETASRSPEKCLVLAERAGISRDMAWPHVVLADGRLLLRTLDGQLACWETP